MDLTVAFMQTSIPQGRKGGVSFLETFGGVILINL